MGVKHLVIVLDGIFPKTYKRGSNELPSDSLS